MSTRTRGTLLDKYDIKRAHKALYAPSSADFTLVDVPELHYLAIDGHGDPNTAPAYADAIEALYGVSYTLKFESKNALGRDFVVGPLEALWRAADMTAFTSRDKDSWAWTAMIVQPDWITAEMVAAATAKLKSKKPLAAIDELRLLTLNEGLSVQILHIGSYDDEAPTLDRLHHEYLPANGLDFNGDHHEIYISDARRTEPAKLKTVLRQPVRRR
ncbi:GyrI-like domain-containing protein [Leifsonia sp. Root4]|uniref:GyrI-like domain-containing protein n=1 Tax=Leifsonia sp. Root4 TaxID=1736525 RepID=UPI000B0199A0|nr:GyrI-like domain-containing protein [Leifsonia sp. Root4]